LAIERIRVNADAAARAAASLAHGLDLVIFAQPERLHTSLLEAQIAAGLIALAGRPSLMVPRRSAPIWPPRRVLLAWDGRAGASRAAFGALDIMREAQSVLILAVDRLNGAGRKLEAPIALDEVAAWLLAHGVKAESLRLQSTAEPAHVVCAALRDHAIDLAVMGGYGRVGGDDLMIGSTTAATLAQVEAPVLFGG
jgi:nucleotide-binding universal stress UspA family protein